MNQKNLFEKKKKDSKSKQKSTNRNFPFFVNDVYGKKIKKTKKERKETHGKPKLRNN